MLYQEFREIQCIKLIKKVLVPENPKNESCKIKK